MARWPAQRRFCQAGSSLPSPSCTGCTVFFKRENLRWVDLGWLFFLATNRARKRGQGNPRCERVRRDGGNVLDYRQELFREQKKERHSQFHDEVDFALVFVGLQQLDDVGVFEPVGKPTNKNGEITQTTLSVKTDRTGGGRRSQQQEQHQQEQHQQQQLDRAAASHLPNYVTTTTCVTCLQQRTQATRYSILILILRLRLLNLKDTQLIDRYMIHTVTS